MQFLFVRRANFGTQALFAAELQAILRNEYDGELGSNLVGDALLDTIGHCIELPDVFTAAYPEEHVFARAKAVTVTYDNGQPLQGSSTFVAATVKLYRKRRFDDDNSRAFPVLELEKALQLQVYVPGSQPKYLLLYTLSGNATLLSPMLSKSRSTMSRYQIDVQAEFGPALLSPLHCLVQINIAGVDRASLVLDPCCGTGVTSAVYAKHVGACCGADISDSYLRSERWIRTGAVVQADLHDERIWRPDTFDAVLTDLPYGCKTSTGGATASTAIAPVDALVALAARTLRPGGVLSFWFCRVSDADVTAISHMCKPLGMSVVTRCSDGCKSGIERELWTVVKGGCIQRLASSQAQQRRAQWEACMPAHESLCSPLDLFADPAGPGSVFEAARRGQLAQLSAAAPMVDMRDAQGKTLLHYACGYGQFSVAKWLLADANCQSHVNCRCDKGSTPLIMAASQGHCAIVALLLEHGALLDLANEKGETAVLLCCNYGHRQVLQVLQQCQQYYDAMLLPPSTTSALDQAARYGHSTVMQGVLYHDEPATESEKHDLARVRPIWMQNQAALASALLLAIRWGHTDAARLLLALHKTLRAADRLTVEYVAQSTKEGTLLHTAAYHGRLACASLLMQHLAQLEQETGSPVWAMWESRNLAGHLPSDMAGNQPLRDLLDRRQG